MTSAATASGLTEAAGDKPKVAPTRRYFSELRASLKNALDVTSDLEQVGAGEGSRPSLPVAPDSPLDYDPLEAAITVLSHLRRSGPLDPPLKGTETMPRQRRILETAAPAEPPRRITQGEIIRALLEGGATEHSSVTITRNARGVVQLEVTCRTADSGGVETIQEAETVAREVYDRLREAYPYIEPEPSDARAAANAAAKGAAMRVARAKGSA